jgi:hypothetical protein
MLCTQTKSGTTLPAPPTGPLLVACHDAGGANLIFSWLRAWLQNGSLNSDMLKLALSGPALVLWPTGENYRVELLSDIETGIHHARCLMSGTGWQSSWEHRARILAKENSVTSIAVLDHWVNYPQRFERGGERCLPDSFLVGDPYAQRLAESSFPGIPVQVFPNLYLQSQLSQIAPLQQGQGDVLYLLEPARNQWGRDEPGEFQALDFFFLHWNATGMAQTSIRLRPHPSDPVGKYDAWIARHVGAGVRLDEAETLAEAISRAAVVVGLETNAMVIALAAGRKVISSLPPWGGSCSLPQEGICMLRDMSSVSS